MQLDIFDHEFILEFLNNSLYKKSYFKNTIIPKLDVLVSDKLTERTGKCLVFWYLNGIEDYPACPVCGSEIHRLKPSKLEYKVVCSSICSGHYTTMLLTPEKRSAALKKTREKLDNKTPQENQQIRAKVKSTLLSRYGVDSPQKVPEFKEKQKKTCLLKYGVENPMQSPDVWAKSISTKREMYGDDMGMVTKKQQATMIERYGVAVPMQHPEMREKIKNTNLAKYGVEWNIASVQSREKQIETNLQRYGTECSMNNVEIREKLKKTIFEKYGVVNVSQSPMIHEKKMRSGYQSKTFTFPSGRTVLVQGYEDRALEILLQEFSEDEIVVDQPNIPTIKWVDDAGKSRVYLPDIFIPTENLLIEVKSVYTYNVALNTNLLKKKFSEQAGFKFKFMIL